MKKQRLLDLQNKAEQGNAEVSDCIEILSEFFISQSNNNKDFKNDFIAINNKLDAISKKLDQLIKFNSIEPLAQILLENLDYDEN